MKMIDIACITLDLLQQQTLDTNQKKYRTLFVEKNRNFSGETAIEHCM